MPSDPRSPAASGGTLLPVLAMVCMGLVVLALAASLILAPPRVPASLAGWAQSMPQVLVQLLPPAAGLIGLLGAGLALLAQRQAPAVPPERVAEARPGADAAGLAVLAELRGLLAEERAAAAALRADTGGSAHDAIMVGARLAGLAQEVETRLVAAMERADNAAGTAAEPDLLLRAAEASLRVERAIPELAELMRRGVASPPPPPSGFSAAAAVAASATHDAAARLAEVADTATRVFGTALADAAGQIEALGGVAAQLRRDAGALDQAGREIAAAGAAAMARAGETIGHVDAALAPLPAAGAALSQAATMAADRMAEMADRAGQRITAAAGEAAAQADRLEQAAAGLLVQGEDAAARIGAAAAAAGETVAALPEIAAGLLHGAGAADAAAGRLDSAGAALAAQAGAAVAAIGAAADGAAQARAELQAASSGLERKTAELAALAAGVDAQVAVMKGCAAALDETSLALAEAGMGLAADGQALRADGAALVGQARQVANAAAEWRQDAATQRRDMSVLGGRLDECLADATAALTGASGTLAAETALLAEAGRNAGGAAAGLRAGAETVIAAAAGLEQAAQPMLDRLASGSAEAARLVAQLGAESGAALARVADRAAELLQRTAAEAGAARERLDHGARMMAEAGGAAATQVARMAGIAGAAETHTAMLPPMIDQLARAAGTLEAGLSAWSPERLRPDLAALAEPFAAAEQARLATLSQAISVMAAGVARIDEGLTRLDAMAAQQGAVQQGAADQGLAALAELRAALAALPGPAPPPASRLDGMLGAMDAVERDASVLLTCSEALAEDVLAGRAPALPPLLADRAPCLLAGLETTIRQLRSVATALALASDGMRPPGRSAA